LQLECEFGVSVQIERWRQHYNHLRQLSAFGWRPPIPETILPPLSAPPYAELRPDQMFADERRILTQGMAPRREADHFDGPFPSIADSVLVEIRIVTWK
jgi:hypothetical protein